MIQLGFVGNIQGESKRYLDEKYKIKDKYFDLTVFIASNAFFIFLVYPSIPKLHGFEVSLYSFF